MFRRWAYMAIAVFATVLITAKPIFSFHADKGILYTRSFSMDLKEFKVTQTILETVSEEQRLAMPEKEVKETMSVVPLYVLQKILFWSCIVCIFLIYPAKARWYMTWLIMALVAVFYVLVIIYSQRISDLHFATLAPTWSAFMPAVVLAMMILLNRNVARFGMYFDDIVE